MMYRTSMILLPRCPVTPAVAGATEAQTFEWIQTRAVSDRTLVEALSNELDIGEAEAIALVHHGGNKPTDCQSQKAGFMAVLPSAFCLLPSAFCLTALAVEI
jgi:hypothetical protein